MRIKELSQTKWIAMDLMASEGSAGEDPNAEKVRYYEGDKDLLAAANAVKDTYTKGKVVEGTIGSADVWNNEVDRIKWFHTKYGTSVEEMEGAAAAQIAKAYDVPFLGIRVLSNNKTNGGKYNPNTAAANQEYVYEVVKSISIRCQVNKIISSKERLSNPDMNDKSCLFRGICCFLIHY